MKMCNTTLGEVARYYNGRAFKSTEWEVTGMPIIRIQNLNNKEAEYNRTSKNYEEKYLVVQGDLLFAWSASLGAHVWVGEDAWLNQHIFKVVPNQGTDKMYLYFFMLHIIDELYARTHGSGMVHIIMADFKNTPIYLPSLGVQAQIVDQIESLFEKLDHAKELIQNALDSFENRKSAILHQAFSGELTKKWRAEKCVSKDTWSMKTLSELCSSFQYGTSKKSETSGKVIVIRMGNLQKGKIDWDNLAYTNDESDIQKYFLNSGDVLFNRTNSPELVGKTSIYLGEYPAIFAGYLIRLNYLPSLNSEYLNFFMNSSMVRKYCNEVKSDGVNQSNINAKKVATLCIPYCSLPEQCEIVRILNAFSENERTAREFCDMLDKIDVMKKAILARAFRGELGTNDFTEPNAMELCKIIINV